jgi:Mrp family chromosome partitioning ATPase
MKKIAFISLKGGTGKTTCTSQTGLALLRRGRRIGFLDLDVHGPNLHIALGFDKTPKLEMDHVLEAVLPIKNNGYEIMSMAFQFGEGNRILWLGQDKLKLAKETVTGVIAWGDLDYLIIDTPPSQSEEVMGLFDNLPDLHGVVIISQPTDFSKADNDRVLDFLRDRKIPIIGMIANMDGCLCPHCGHRFYPFMTRRANIEEYASQNKIPFLASIPQVSSIDGVQSIFQNIAEKLETIQPVKLPTHEARKEFKRKGLKIVLEGKNA